MTNENPEVIDIQPQQLASVQARLGSFPAPTCHHGPKKHKSGQGAKGPWQAWMCPSAKGTPDQCQPMWIKRGEVGWVA